MMRLYQVNSVALRLFCHLRVQGSLSWLSNVICGKRVKRDNINVKINKDCLTIIKPF